MAFIGAKIIDHNNIDLLYTDCKASLFLLEIIFKKNRSNGRKKQEVENGKKLYSQINA